MWQIDWSKIAEVLTYQSDKPMIFSSGLFLFLFLGFSLVYALLRKKDTARILFVILFSYYFYYKSSGTYFFLLGIVTVADFFIAGRMARIESRARRRALLLLSLSINLGLLFYFKYTNFFYQMLAPLWNGSFQPLDIFLPVGISFFTFQSLSYTIDVYRRQLQPLHRLLDYAFYVSFFPQLVAGPIVRARDFIPQIRKPLFVSTEMFGQGVFFIVSGLFKKAVISDYISVNFVERIFDNPGLYSGIENLFGVYGYALQIYCDFSGYSDMAIGIALLLGFRFPINFNSPYKADSITDFWHRWHISLSTWLRDYLYISLGGNRKGQVRTYVNLLIVFFATGLWHGAGATFFIWGLYHGLFLVVERMGLGKLLEKNCFRGLNHIYTALVVVVGWVFFRADTLADAKVILHQMFTWENGIYPASLFVNRKVIFLAVLGVLLSGIAQSICPKLREHLYEKEVTKTVDIVIMAVLLFLCTMYLVSSTYNPFIYFRF